MEPEASKRPRTVSSTLGLRIGTVLLALLGIILFLWMGHGNRVALRESQGERGKDLVEDVGPALVGTSSGELDVHPPLRVDNEAVGEDPRPRAMIAGRVVDQDGAPVRARIILLGSPPRIHTHVAWTEDGRFRFDDLDPECEYGLGVRVSPLGPGDRTTAPRERRLRPSGAPVEIVVNRRLFVTGRLSRTDRKHVGVIRVRAIRELPEPFACDVLTDGDGHFDLGPLRPGRYRIGAEPGAEGGWVPELAFDAPAHGWLHLPILNEATLALHHERTPKVKVHWRPTGLSIDARSLKGSGSYGGSTGDWILIGGRPGQPPVSGTVFVRSGWRSALVEDVLPSTRPVEIEFRYGRWFEGRVGFDKPLEDGERRTGFVLARSVRYAFTESYPVAADGTFQAIGLPPGTYELSYSADGRTSTGPVAAHRVGSPTAGIVLQAR